MASIDSKIIGEAKLFMAIICGIMKTDCTVTINIVREI